MIVKIENRISNLSCELNNELESFDVKDGKFFCVNKVITNQITEIYEYDDFSVLWCIVVKNNAQYVRFVLFNMQKKQSFVLFEVEIANIIKLFRINKNIFVLISDGEFYNLCIAVFSCGEIKNETMQFGKIKNVFKLNSEEIIVHSINEFNNEFYLLNLLTMQRKVVFNFMGEVQARVCDKKLQILNNKKIIKTIK